MAATSASITITSDSPITPVVSTAMPSATAEHGEQCDDQQQAVEDDERGQRAEFDQYRATAARPVWPHACAHLMR
jgi:hypothetical protein